MACVWSVYMAISSYLVLPYGLVMPVPVGEVSKIGTVASPYTVAEEEKMNLLMPKVSSSCSNATVEPTFAS